MGILLKCNCKVSLPLFDSFLVNPLPTRHKMQARFWRHINILFDYLCPTPSHSSSSTHHPLSRLELADKEKVYTLRKRDKKAWANIVQDVRKHIQKWWGHLASITTLNNFVRVYALEVFQSLHVLSVPKVVVFMTFYRFGTFEMFQFSMIFKWSGRLAEPPPRKIFIRLHLLRVCQMERVLYIFPRAVCSKCVPQE